MINAGLPEISNMDDLNFLKVSWTFSNVPIQVSLIVMQDTLQIGKSEEEAQTYFQDIYDDTRKKEMFVSLNWLAHNKRRNNNWWLGFHFFFSGWVIIFLYRFSCFLVLISSFLLTMSSMFVVRSSLPRMGIGLMILADFSWFLTFYWRGEPLEIVYRNATKLTDDGHQNMYYIRCHIDAVNYFMPFVKDRCYCSMLVTAAPYSGRDDAMTRVFYCLHGMYLSPVLIHNNIYCDTWISTAWYAPRVLLHDSHQFFSGMQYCFGE